MTRRYTNRSFPEARDIFSRKKGKDCFANRLYDVSRAESKSFHKGPV